jgi:hypothetical protein
MTKSNSRAGGFLLTVAILAGLVAGVIAGNPMGGVLVGTAAGVLIALAVWLIDRRRRRA